MAKTKQGQGSGSGGGREKGTRTSERGQQDLRQQTGEQSDLTGRTADRPEATGRVGEAVKKDAQDKPRRVPGGGERQ